VGRVVQSVRELAAMMRVLGGRDRKPVCDVLQGCLYQEDLDCSAKEAGTERDVK
jgi:hypothetical protein